MVGAYLLYIDYQIFGDVMAREGTSRIVMTAFMFIFAVTGIMLIILSGMGLMGSGPWGDARGEDRGRDGNVPSGEKDASAEDDAGEDNDPEV